MKVGHHQNFDCNKDPAHRRAGFMFDNQNYNADLHRPHNSETVVADSKNNMEVGHNQNLDCNKDHDHKRACSLFDNQNPDTTYPKTWMNSRPFPDFEEYVVYTLSDTPYIILWSMMKNKQDIPKCAVLIKKMWRICALTSQDIHDKRRANIPYPKDLIRRILRRLMNILEYYIHGTYGKLPNTLY
nr:hypothetical protein [Tanacetum cinerariifolium]GEY32957.1 hypothetical protein [Tanacetum cinerariifolium]